MRTILKITVVLGLLLLIPGLFSFSQVGVNTDSSLPDNSAMLDVKSANKGFLAPRVALTATTDVSTINSPANGLLVYNTATAGSSPTNVTPGYYYYNGTAWTPLASSGDFTHYVGELYGGGIVVAVWKANNVEHGLIASLVDMKTSGNVYTMAWSGNTTVLIGTTAQSPIDGQANTNAIIGQSGGGNMADKAATVCDAYTITDGTGIYNDWYLPSVWELGQCLNASGIVNAILGPTNGFQFVYYWSSKEDETGTGSGAWSISFNFWGPNHGDLKANTNRVRAVRSF